MSYLIFNSYTEAIARSDQAGKDKLLPYHRGDNDPTRYMWLSIAENGHNLRGSLIIDQDQDLLTDSEKHDLLPELPADWQHLPDPFEQ
tara:strand:- start:1282 stop:1545 length:264 start_codon:yes stop_codon:yes gene_type:complete